MEIYNYNKASEVLRAAWDLHHGVRALSGERFLCNIVGEIHKEGLCGLVISRQCYSAIESNLGDHSTWVDYYFGHNRSEMVYHYSPEMLEAKRQWLFAIIEQFESQGE